MGQTWLPTTVWAAKRNLVFAFCPLSAKETKTPAGTFWTTQKRQKAPGLKPQPIGRVKVKSAECSLMIGGGGVPPLRPARRTNRDRSLGSDRHC
jgi:hypothetical protein